MSTYYVSSGQTSTGIILNSADFMHVYESGTANSTTVNSGGELYVSSGGMAVSTMLNSKAWVEVYDGGIMSDTTINSKGARLIVSGGTVNNAVVSSGNIYVYGGGLVNTAQIHNGLLIYDGTAENITIATHGYLHVDSGGMVNRAIVGPQGHLEVLSGGTALNVVWTPCVGLVDACDGATVTYASSYSGVYFGYNDTLLASAPTMNNRVLSSDYSMYVMSGGVASQTTINSDGWLDVSSGGMAASTAINAGGELYVTNGGTANSTTVNNGWITVDEGGTINYTDITGDDGLLHVYGTANSTSVTGGGLFIYGTARDTAIGSGGDLHVYGGKVTGTLTMGKDANANVFGIIDFDISALTSEAPARVNDLSLIQGTPDYTVTVSATQAEGEYKLAEGAAGFNQSVTIYCNNTELGSLSVGETVTLAGQDYTLNLTDDLLSFTVGSVIPVAGVSDDLNGDGRADIVMTITQSGHGAEGATGAWLIQQDQTAAWGDLSQRNPGWEIFGMGTTTANKATADVYVRSTGNVIGAWTTDESGHVAGWETVGEFSADTQVLGLGDFNGNGQTDLLLRNANGAVGCFFTGGDVTGWNYFQSLGDEWKISAVGDLNGDGRADVVLKHDAGFAGSWLTQADCTMAWADLDTLPDGFEIVGAGDFNGDGTDDVLLKSGNYYGAWLVQNGNAAGWMGLGDLGDITVEQIADFDGDGKDDLRIRTAAGDLGTQLVRGADTLEWHYYGSVGAEWSTGLAAAM